MATKTINEVRTTVAAADAHIMFDVSDNYDSGDNHPRCLYVEVTLRDGENQTVWLQQVTRDGDGNVTGRVPNLLTSAQLTTLRGLLKTIFDQAALDAGYTL